METADQHMGPEMRRNIEDSFVRTAADQDFLFSLLNQQILLMEKVIRQEALPFSAV